MNTYNLIFTRMTNQRFIINNSKGTYNQENQNLQVGLHRSIAIFNQIGSNQALYNPIIIRHYRGTFQAL